MASAGLKSDAWCSYNQAAAPFFWTFQQGQYQNTIATGEVGISAAGGTAGSYVRPDIVDVDSFLSGRDDILSKCQPPVPEVQDPSRDLLKEQPGDTIELLPVYTREKRSAIDLSSIDYNRWVPQDIDPQDLRFVIEDFSSQRGGLDSRNYIKLAWNTDQCNYNLDPDRACGPECSPVSGYKQQARSIPQARDYPFPGPYSQNLWDVGIQSGGENFFYGPRYDQGQLPPQK